MDVPGASNQKSLSGNIASVVAQVQFLVEAPPTRVR